MRSRENEALDARTHLRRSPVGRISLATVGLSAAGRCTVWPTHCLAVALLATDIPFHPATSTRARIPHGIFFSLHVVWYKKPRRSISERSLKG